VTIGEHQTGVIGERGRAMVSEYPVKGEIIKGGKGVVVLVVAGRKGGGGIYNRTFAKI